jgi:MFS family permease
MESVARSASSKIAWRLIPFLMICYFAAYLDRVNLGFAALTFKADLGLSDAVYGLGAGIFFAGYFIFEVPSNIVLEKVGARVWIARIMITWGIVSAAMAFVSNETLLEFAIGDWQFRITTFYITRFLLGVAEAGFFPGIILYLTYWYTSVERTKMIGLFMVAIALSGVIGAPLSSIILTNLAGVENLKSWQWLFILEALPAIVLGVATYFYLTDRPSEAHWLDAEERRAVAARLDAEKAAREAIKKFSLGEALVHPKLLSLSPLHLLALVLLIALCFKAPQLAQSVEVAPAVSAALTVLPYVLIAFTILNPQILGLALIYFGIVTGLYGLGFWLPQIVKAFGLTTGQTGWVVAIPYVFSALVMVPWARNSDITQERVWHVSIAAFLGGAGIIAGAYLKDPFLAMGALTLGSIGTFAALPTFWSLPTALLTGTAAAAGIALINAIGNLGGFVGPYLVGWIRDTWKDPSLATASLGGFMIVAGVITILLGHDRRMEAVADAVPAE